MAFTQGQISILGFNLGQVGAIHLSTDEWYVACVKDSDARMDLGVH